MLDSQPVFGSMQPITEIHICVLGHMSWLPFFFLKQLLKSLFILKKPVCVLLIGMGW